jgi:hypothetical protein
VPGDVRMARPGGQTAIGPSQSGRIRAAPRLRQADIFPSRMPSRRPATVPHPSGSMALSRVSPRAAGPRRAALAPGVIPGARLRARPGLRSRSPTAMSGPLVASCLGCNCAARPRAAGKLAALAAYAAATSAPFPYPPGVLNSVTRRAVHLGSAAPRCHLLARTAPLAVRRARPWAPTATILGSRQGPGIGRSTYPDTYKRAVSRGVGSKAQRAGIVPPSPIGRARRPVSGIGQRKYGPGV